MKRTERDLISDDGVADTDGGVGRIVEDEEHEPVAALGQNEVSVDDREGVARWRGLQGSLPELVQRSDRSPQVFESNTVM